MPSTFVQHHTKALIDIGVFPPSTSTTATRRTLSSLLLSLKSPPTISQIYDATTYLERNSTSASDVDEIVLKKLILDKLVVGVYAETLDTYLLEAIAVETEAEWWADIEHSNRLSVAYYLLQTLPSRLAQLTRTILHTIHTRGISVRPSLFTPASFRHLFPSTGDLRPNALVTAIFPHLQHRKHLAYIASLHSFPPLPAVNSITTLVTQCTRRLCHGLNLPIDLARHECRFKRKALEEIRDEKAKVLGALSKMRESLEVALFKRPTVQDENPDARTWELAQFVREVSHLADTKFPSPSPLEHTCNSMELCHAIQQLAEGILRHHTYLHTTHLRAGNLLRPSRLTLLWPRPVFLLPGGLYVIHQFYSSPTSVIEIVKEAVRTMEGFLRGYILEPLKDVVKTVRTGGENGIIIRKEGINADLDSLERMALSLAQDKLHYNPVQLASLSQQIRLGDLTPILQIYEANIKSPWKSAILGTLVRSLFIQVQKAKVDLDQALAGIDKLLRSQELTFAFVGVAPAFAILYFAGGFFRKLWSVGKSRGKYGGKRRRAGAWLAIRRLERLLISRSDRLSPGDNDIPPSTTGLLLLSVTRLRNFAETCLPADSQLQEGFLQDVGDLEDPSLNRSEKLRVVDRMWRSWDSVLKWGNITEEGI